MPIGRPSFFLEIGSPGQISSICEECRKANFLLENLTWGNSGRSASERFPSDPRTHISTILVHRALFFEKKGGGKTGWWKDGVPNDGEPTRFSRARDDFSDTPYAPRDGEPSARGFGDASDASQARMPRTLFYKKKVSGEKGVPGGGASSIRGIAPGSRRDSPRDTDRAISRRAARVVSAECAWDKEIPRSSWIPGSIGARRRGRLSAWLRP